MISLSPAAAPSLTAVPKKTLGMFSFDYRLK